MKRKINIIVHDNDNNDAVVYTFKLIGDIQNPTDAMMQAVQEYISTEQGKEIVKNNGGRFSWTDAIKHMSKECWNKYGLKYENNDLTLDYMVDYNESII